MTYIQCTPTQPQLIAVRRPVLDGPNVKFIRSGARTGGVGESTNAVSPLTAIKEALPGDWLKAPTEVERFEAFRSLPGTAKLELLAYCVAVTLQPKLGPTDGDEASGYDAALALTGCNVAGYWRPTRDNFLSRRNRVQLLELGREVLGEPWAQSHVNDKKASLVDQLDRAFSNPGMSGRTPDQSEKLKSWLPAGMSFGIVPTPKPAKAKKARKAA